MAGRKRPGQKRASRATKEAEANPLHLSRPLAVRLLGVSDRTFQRLEAEGVITPLAAGKGTRHSVYDAPVVVAAYLARQERLLTGSNQSPRDRKDRSQAELNELRLARERGAVLPHEQVVKDGRAYIRATMAKLRAIPSRLVRAGLIPSSAEAAVAELIREAQEEMARWQNALDLERAITEKA